MSQKTKSVLNRLLKGFVSGSVATMLGVAMTAPATWTEMGNIINILLLSGLFGGINGVLLASEKWVNWKE